jgi:hypothetical protein
VDAGTSRSALESDAAAEVLMFWTRNKSIFTLVSASIVMRPYIFGAGYSFRLDELIRACEVSRECHGKE